MFVIKIGTNARNSCTYNVYYTHAYMHWKIYITCTRNLDEANKFLSYSYAREIADLYEHCFEDNEIWNKLIVEKI